MAGLGWGPRLRRGTDLLRLAERSIKGFLPRLGLLESYQLQWGSNLVNEKIVLGRMFVMNKLFLILVLVLALVPATVVADGVTVMFGAQSVSFGADLGNYYDIPPGAGITLLVGMHVGIPVDLRVGRRTATDGNSGGDATYQWLEFGPRFALGKKDADIRGDLFLGVGTYDLEVGALEFDRAIGSYVGMGVEEAVSEKFIGRVEVKGVYFKSDTLNTDGASLNISLLFGYKF
jgi:hypothetical protein